jgi:hypothetical protein
MNKKFNPLVYKLKVKTIKKGEAEQKIRTYQHLPQILSELQPLKHQNQNQNKKPNTTQRRENSVAKM